MTEQKIIESLNDWWEAVLAGKCQLAIEARWDDYILGPENSIYPFGLMENIKAGKYRWKPEEYEYVTMESFRLGEFSEYQYQDQDDGEWISLTAESVSWMIGPIINSMKKKENRLRRKKAERGGEIELVEWKPIDRNDSNLWAEKKVIYLNGYEQTGRTFKGVIHEE